MAVQIQMEKMTVADFDRWVLDQDGDYEFIAGEVSAVVSNNYASQVAMVIGAFLTVFTRQNDLGWVTGADGGYMVSGGRFLPDVGFIRKTRQPQPSRDTYNPNAPDLAVEVVSPTDSERKLLLKVSTYLAAGTEVWVVYPDVREVHVHRPGKSATALSTDATLTSDLLPGFALPVSAIFPAEDAPASPQGT
ncbi:Uma2 family endonuclease [bacterium]|nr:Uma2 family endonuclease [bacterium]